MVMADGVPRNLCRFADNLASAYRVWRLERRLGVVARAYVLNHVQVLRHDKPPNRITRSSIDRSRITLKGPNNDNRMH